MTDYGLKVSRNGYNIDTASVANQTFNSEKNCLKLDVTNNSDTKSYSVASGGSDTKTFAHGFDFTPGFLVWFEVDNSGDWYFMYTPSSEGCYCRPYTDSTNLNVEIGNSDSSSHTINFYYVLIADTT